MPLDAVCLTALMDELAPELEGAHIDKVQQPARDLLLLSLYSRRGSRRLLISAGVGMARLHFTSERFENPEQPPMFCMLLRKHLTGAVVERLWQPESERIAVFELSCRDELGVESKKRLAVELMGRSSNIVLVDGEGVIIDCLRRADFGEEAYRRLLPGMLYRLPPRPAKPNPLELTSAERRARLADTDRDKPADKRLAEAFSGLSPLIARELAHRSERGELAMAVDAFCDSVQAHEFTPCLLTENGAARDFTFMGVTQYGEAVRCEPRGGFSALLDEFYSERERAERMRRVSHELTKTVKTLRDRQARKLAQQRQELAKTADREELRRRGDLITANLWRAEKGARALLCEDYYAEGCPTVEIKLDPLKTPQQNAAAAYKEYKKAAAAEQHLTKLIAEGEALLDYLEGTLDALSRVESEKEAAEIRRELIAAKVLRQPRQGGGKERKIKPLGPIRYVSDTGYEILIGRSNTQNDELTFKIARRTDIWLHVQKLHGSHVIIRAEDTRPDEGTILEAAALAAKYSQAAGSGKVPVDYTMAKNVKKPSGALPGKVIYTNYETVTVTPKV